MQCFVDTMQNADRRTEVVLYQQSQELRIWNHGYIESIINGNISVNNSKSLAEGH